MSLTDTSSATNLTPHAWEPSPFKLVSIEKAIVPQGGARDTWYNYVLDNGRSKIVGTHRGSLQVVSDYATQYALELNVRAVACQSAWSTRPKKPG